MLSDIAAPAISVILCTYNRVAVLAETLESFAAQRGADEPSVELLIVDNNSSDDTRKVTERHIASYPNTRYVFEAQPGLSHARNTGISESRGEIAVFVDDDVYFDPGWLCAVIDCFEKRPEAAAMGGRSEPIFEAGRPSWLSDEMLMIYGDTRLGDQARWMVPPEQPFGLNMAFRREVFEKIGFFDPSLGRIGKKLLSNEEKDYFHRLARASLKVWYDPDALLFHRIPTSRTQQEWVISRYYWQGISDAIFDQGAHPRSRAALLSEGVGEVWRALSAMRGQQLSPRKIRWHYLGISLIAKADYWEVLGRGWSKIRMAFRLGHSSASPTSMQRT